MHLVFLWCCTGCTASTSTVIIPMIQNQKGLTVKQRLELWDQQFTLSVTRWTPLGILGALSYLYAAYSWSGEITTASDYKSSTTLTWAGGAMLGMIPLTVTLIFPVVGKLKKLKSLPSEQLKDGARRSGVPLLSGTVGTGAVSRAADSAFCWASTTLFSSCALDCPSALHCNEQQ